MNAPTMQQRAIGAADHAQRYADVQNLPLPSHSDALRAVMEAGERAAHLSRGYTPESVQPSLADEMRPLDVLLVVGWFAFGLALLMDYLYYALAASL